MDGTLIEDGAPACKICGVKVMWDGESTSNMTTHLQENHEGVHTEVQVHVVLYLYVYFLCV